MIANPDRKTGPIYGFKIGGRFDARAVPPLPLGLGGAQTRCGESAKNTLLQKTFFLRAWIGRKRCAFAHKNALLQNVRTKRERCWGY